MELATGVKPKALQEKPVLFGIASEIAQAYNVLASRRTMGMAPNPISLSEILSFVKIYGRPSISLHIFIDLLGTMDLKYLEMVSGNLGKRPS